MTRKVAVFTGTRADYGLLRPLMKSIKEDESLELQTIVSGSHLEKSYGETWKNIIDDGFTLEAKINIYLDDDTPLGISNSLSKCVYGVASAIDRLKPDLLIVLGDRYEAMAAAQAAMVSRIPIAHIHGGESTEGLIDEAIRHSITKMSHLHFVAAEDYRKKVIQLGEQPRRVEVVGASCLDNFNEMKFLDFKEIEKKLSTNLVRPIILGTYHPTTLDHELGLKEFENMLLALKNIQGSIILTGSNADTESNDLRKILETHTKDFKNLILKENLGSQLYLSLMSQSDLVIGNSSSGIIEAPALGIPVVNIGNRQKGRLTSPGIINSSGDIDSILSSITKSLTKEHLEISRKKISPYGKPGSALRITDIIKKVNLDGILDKRFFNLNVEQD